MGAVCVCVYPQHLATSFPAMEHEPTNQLNPNVEHLKNIHQPQVWWHPPKDWRPIVEFFRTVAVPRHHEILANALAFTSALCSVQRGTDGRGVYAKSTLSARTVLGLVPGDLDAEPAPLEDGQDMNWTVQIKGKEHVYFRVPEADRSPLSCLNDARRYAKPRGGRPRLVNNARAILCMWRGLPRLVVVTSMEIPEGEEIFLSWGNNVNVKDDDHIIRVPYRSDGAASAPMLDPLPDTEDDLSDDDDEPDTPDEASDEVVRVSPRRGRPPKRQPPQAEPEAAAPSPAKRPRLVITVPPAIAAPPAPARPQVDAEVEQMLLDEGIPIPVVDLITGPRYGAVAPKLLRRIPMTPLYATLPLLQKLALDDIIAHL